MNISFRPISDADLELLYQIYASTREDELRLVDWTAQEQECFLRQQFRAQHTHYQQHYADAQFAIILINDQPGGRLYLDRRQDEYRIVDISLLPQHRRKGIGRRIMLDVLDEAAAGGKPVRIHVEQNNPALRLYERLGFERIGETGVYLLMERRCGSP